MNTMPYVDRLVSDEVKELVDLYSSIQHNEDMQIDAVGFRRRCEASLGNGSVELHQSDDFGSRDVTIRSTVYTFKVESEDSDDDTIVGCATVCEKISDDFMAEGLSIFDLCFRDDMYDKKTGGGEISVYFINELIAELYFTPRRWRQASVYYFAAGEHAERLAGALQRCHFEKTSEPREQLVFVDPPYDEPLPTGEQRSVRTIAAWRLDVQRASIRSRE